MKYLPKKIKFKSFKSDLENLNNIKFSDSLIERISESGDISGSPFAHWRWKKKYLADLIIYPTSNEEISEILKLANKYNIPITPRGAGICYFGSDVPTLGGVVLDLKKMNKFEVNLKDQIITAQTGTCFINLINALKDTAFELPCYPSSALSSTVGGWIAIGAKIGIGSFQNGSFIDYINKMDIVLPSGELKSYTSKKDFERFFNSYGIYGLITNIELKLVPKSEKFPISLGFNSLENVIDALNELIKLSSINFIHFYDSNYATMCNSISDQSYYIFIIFNCSASEVERINAEIKNVIIKNQGEVLDKKYANDLYISILKQEIALKAKVPVLMLQSYLLDLIYCKEIIVIFENLIKKRGLNHASSGFVNKDLKVRLNLFTPTDSKYIVHFLSSKAILHKIAKILYKNKKGEVYTYGLLNTIYLHKYQKEKQDEIIQQKQEYDSKFILNPYKVILSRTSFRRINTIFIMNLFWRMIAKKIVTAKVVNIFEVNDKLKKNN